MLELHYIAHAALTRHGVVLEDVLDKYLELHQSSMVYIVVQIDEIALHVDY